MILNSCTLISNNNKYFKFHYIKILFIKILIIIIITIFYLFHINIFLIFYKLKINYFLDNQNNYINLKEKSLINKSLINKEKVKIISYLSKKINKKIEFINSISYKKYLKLGNLLCALNKLIFYCEIINCKNILLDKNIFWFIKNKIQIKSNNITLDVINKRQNNNSFEIFYFHHLYSKFFTIKPEIRINLLRLEIIKHLPKIITYENFLYIHLRSGDIFKKYIVNADYAQPPLCFYQNIINKYKFDKIYIISKDNMNPVINKLIKYYPDIIFKQNSIKEDISCLINAYNIVVSISSFLISIISLNINLKYLWDYNIYKFAQKIFHFHYDFYKFPYENFKILRMNPSKKYREIMFNWKNNRRQKKLMLKEKCNNHIFYLILKKKF